MTRFEQEVSACKLRWDTKTRSALELCRTDSERIRCVEKNAGLCWAEIEIIGQRFGMDVSRSAFPHSIPDNTTREPEAFQPLAANEMSPAREPGEADGSRECGF